MVEQRWLWAVLQWRETSCNFINKMVITGTVVWCYVVCSVSRHVIGCFNKTWVAGTVKLSLAWRRNSAQVVHRLENWPLISKSLINTISFPQQQQICIFLWNNDAVSPTLTVTRTLSPCQQQQQSMEFCLTVGLHQCFLTPAFIFANMVWLLFSFPFHIKYTESIIESITDMLQ